MYSLKENTCLRASSTTVKTEKYNCIIPIYERNSTQLSAYLQQGQTAQHLCLALTVWQNRKEKGSCSASMNSLTAAAAAATMHLY